MNHTGPTSKSISMLILEVSDLMKKEQPIPKRNQYAMTLANAAPQLLKMLTTVHRDGAGMHYDAISELIAKANGKTLK